MSSEKYKFYFFSLNLFMGILLFSPAQAELKTEFIFGDEVLVDTETRTLWSSDWYADKNLQQAKDFCGNFDHIIPGWGLPSEAEVSDFLLKLHATNPSGRYYDRTHWTNEIHPYNHGGVVYYKAVDINSSGTINLYASEASDTGPGIGVRCKNKLPDYTIDGTATAPTFISDQLSVSTLKQGETIKLTSYWHDEDDPLKYAKARYKVQGAADWTIADMDYDQGLLQFRARYTKDITVNTVGTYDVQFLAASEDGAVTESAWLGSGLIFTVESDGTATPPELVAGNATLSGRFVGESIGFYARWKDSDGEPHIFNTLMRYRKQGNSTWSAEQSMNLDEVKADFTEFTNVVVINGSAGIYEVQFQASSSADSSQVNSASSGWLPVTPRTFELNEVVAIDGQCDTDNQITYRPNATGWNGDTFCTTGVASPAHPAFPAKGNVTSWNCLGEDGGNDAFCSASRLSPIIVTPPENEVATTGIPSDTNFNPNVFKSEHDIDIDCLPCEITGNPVNISSGSQVIRLPLLSVQGLLPIQFTLNYNSVVLIEGDVGRGWSHSNGFNALLAEDDNGDVTIRWSASRQNTFIKQADGTYQASELAARLDQLTKSADGFALIRKDRTTYTFDSNDILQSIETPKGQKLLFSFDAQGYLARITEPVSGVFLDYLYNTDGLLEKVADPLGREVSLLYDDQANLISITDAIGDVITYEYNDRGQAVQKFINGNEIIHSRNTFDDQGRIIEQNDVRTDNQSITITYDETSQPDLVISEYTDRLGRTSQVIHNRDYQLLEKTDALGGKTLNTYDDNGKRTSTTDANGLTTTFTYNDNGDLTSISDSLGRTTSLEYDDQRNLVKITNALGEVTQSVYDDNNNRISQTNPLGQQTTYTYNDHNQVMTITSPLGRVTTLSYENGRIASVTNAEGETTTYAYDAAGRRTSQTDSTGAVTQYVYDALDRIIEVIDPLGNRYKTTYDARGNVLTETDSKGNITQYEYDGVGNLIKLTDPLGNITQFSYDGEDRLLSVTDANGNTTQYEYDVLGRQISMTDAQGNQHRYSYDAVGNILSETDALGQTNAQYTYDEVYNLTQFKDATNRTWKTAYDDLNRPVSYTDPLNRITQNHYDAVGRMTGVTDAMGGKAEQAFNEDQQRTQITDLKTQVRQEQRDDNGRLVLEITDDGAEIHYTYDPRDIVTQITNARGQIEVRQYDAAGRLILTSDAVGDIRYEYDANGNLLKTTDDQGTITRTYDALNRITSYTNTRGDTIQYAYDAVGNLQTLTYPDGKTVTYGYDALNRLSSVTDWANRQTSYQYDAKGRITQTTNANGTTETRTYDAADQLIQAKTTDSSDTVILQYDYSYDNAGNITEEKINPAPTPPDFNDMAMVYGAANRLTTFNGSGFDSDADGNMTSVPTNTTGEASIELSFDSRGRVLSAGDLSYVYDAEDQRIESSGVLHTVNPEAGLSQLLLQQSGADKDFFVYGLGLIGQQSDDQFYTFHYDLRGTVTAVTDAAGQVIARFGYLPYAGQYVESGEFDSPFGYNARDGVQTESNGLYYMRARYYSPILRRFVSKDPLRGNIGAAQTLNRLAYVSGNPVISIDPSGLTADKVILAGGVTYILVTRGTKVIVVIKRAKNIKSSTGQSIWQSLQKKAGGVKDFLKKNDHDLVLAIKALATTDLLVDIGEIIRSDNQLEGISTLIGCEVLGKTASLKVPGYKHIEELSSFGVSELCQATCEQPEEDLSSGSGSVIRSGSGAVIKP